MATVGAVHGGDLGFLRCRHFYTPLTGEKRLGWSIVATKSVSDRYDPHERVMTEHPSQRRLPVEQWVRAGDMAMLWVTDREGEA